jgi:hypothetical protein
MGSGKDYNHEYETLKSYVVQDGDENETLVHLLCDPEQSQKLLAWVNKVDPSGAAKITVEADPTDD